MHCEILAGGSIRRGGAIRLAQAVFSGLVFLAVLVFSAKAADRPSALDRVLEAGELRIGTTGDYPPFTERAKQSDDYGGIDIDLARNLAASLGVAPVFVETSWPALMDDLAADRFDIAMGGISRSLLRQRAAFFSAPYYRFGKTPISRCADRDRFDTLAKIDRPGVTVIVNPGGTNEAFAKEHIKRAKLLVHADNRTIFREIAEGRADVMITDSVEVRYQHHLDSSLCATMPGRTFTEAEKAYLLPRDIVWKLYVDAWLAELELQGTLEAVFEKYLGD